jgi:hypothetical protein
MIYSTWSTDLLKKEISEAARDLKELESEWFEVERVYKKRETHFKQMLQIFHKQLNEMHTELATRG